MNLPYRSKELQPAIDLSNGKKWPEEEGKMWGGFGSCQYDGIYERFEEWINDVPAALKELGIKELPKLPPTVTYQDSIYVDATDKEIDISLEVSIRDYFTKARDSSWDLWSAAIGIGPQLFPQFNELLEKTWGKSESEYTAIICFLIWAIEDYPDITPEDLFGGFDT